MVEISSFAKSIFVKSTDCKSASFKGFYIRDFFIKDSSIRNARNDFIRDISIKIILIVNIYISVGAFCIKNFYLKRINTNDTYIMSISNKNTFIARSLC